MYIYTQYIHNLVEWLRLCVYDRCVNDGAIMNVTLLFRVRSRLTVAWACVTKAVVVW